MSTRIRLFIERLATWPVVALLVVVMLLCSQGFTWRQQALGYQNRTLDVRTGYTPADTRQLFEDLGPGGRKLYALTEVTLDLAFPLTYGTLFSILLLRLYGKERIGLFRIPLLTMAADLLENVTAASLALTFNGQESPLAWLAAIFTIIKMVLFLASLVLILVGGFLGLRESVKANQRFTG